jgi:hypothetical protein
MMGAGPAAAAAAVGPGARLRSPALPLRLLAGPGGSPGKPSCGGGDVV